MPDRNSPAQAGFTRRQFLWSAALAGTALAVGYGGWRYERRRRAQRRAPPLGAAAWIEIGAAGAVRIRCNATEMGQGAWSALAQLVCEELEADFAKVVVEQAPVRPEYFAPWGSYGTGGSRSIRGMFDMMRRLGAAARIVLVEAAARRWQAPATECAAHLGKITHKPSGRTLAFAEVAAEAAALTVPADPPLKPRGEWRLIGKTVPREDVARKIEGRALYGHDLRMPGLRFAAIRHCPVPGGRLEGVDAAPATAIAGVEKVVSLEDAVAVVAGDTWTALRGLRALQPRWDLGKHAGVSSEEMFKAFRAAVDSAEVPLVAENADERKSAEAAAPALREAASRVVATYEAPLIAHAQIEPNNATAWFRDGQLELWAPTQQQSSLRSGAAKLLGIAEEKVTVHTPLLGGGFGRRLKNDYAYDAVKVAKQVSHPVQVVWDREEEFLQGYFRPAAVARLEAALAADGTPKALEARIASLDADPRVGGIASQPYEWAGIAVRYAPVPRGVRVGSWRSVDLSQNAFFLESFLDECAAQAKRDPLDCRLALLKSHPRERRVLEAAADMAGWGTRAAQGRHLGLAFAAGFNSMAAAVAEVAVEDGQVRIARLFVAVDCGTAVNPGNVVAQMQGGMLMALGAALAEEITVANGQVQQRSFGAYTILDISKAPPVEVRIVESPEARPGGIGEMGVPVTAPALANAVFAATGVRLRTLPLRKDPRVKWRP